MQYVSSINNWITAQVKDTCLSNNQLFDLVEPIIRRNDDDEQFPCLIGTDDTYTFVDDRYDYGLYHKILTRDYSDAISGYLATDNVIVVCWGFRKTISQYNMERLVYASLLSNKAKPIVSNFDRYSVFSGEFKNFKFFLPEDLFLFSTKYKVSYPADSCFKTIELCQ